MLLELRKKGNKTNSFAIIPTKDWLSDEIMANGIRIDHAKQSNTKVARKMNVIQISTTDHYILYDLDA